MENPIDISAIEKMSSSLVKNSKDPLCVDTEYKSFSLTADSASIYYYVFGHIGPLWLPYRPLQFNVDKNDHVELFIDEVKQDIDLPALIYLRGFFGLGPSILKRRLLNDYSINLKGVCKEPIIVSYDTLFDYIDEQPLFNVTDIIDFGQTAWGLATADFNGDGAMDFATSSATSPWTSSTISIFYNNHDQSFTRADVWMFDDFIRYVSDLDCGDYDNDGDIDLLYTYSEAVNYFKINGTGKLLINNGDNSFPTERTVFWHGPGSPDHREDNRINPQISSADYDLDGDIDFIVGDNSGCIELYLNDGTGRFTSGGILHDYGRISWGVCSGDYDNDGDIDFLVSAEYADFQGAIYLKRNQQMESNHSITFTQDAGEPLLYSSGGVAALELFDVDQDADLDLLIGVSERVYLGIQNNNGIDIYYIGQLPENYEGYGDHLRQGAITTADYNQDGKQDIILGGVQGVIRFCENRYGPLPPFRPSLRQPKEFNPHKELEFGFMSMDINKDNLSYYVEWGDGTNSGWVGPFTSGDEIGLSHVWDETLAYLVRVKAKDEGGLESLWKEYVLILQDEPADGQQQFEEPLFQDDNAYALITQNDCTKIVPSLLDSTYGIQLFQS